MGRWRPPRPRSSPYITQAGFERLKLELKELWPRRREVVAALSAAAAEGDRSENAEYIYRKKQLAGIDRRIRYLQKRLPGLTVVERSPGGDAVRFGAWVRVRRDDDSVVEYRIVGADEIDHEPGNISVDAPVARALIGKSAGDSVSIGGDVDQTLEVVAVSFVPR